MKILSNKKREDVAALLGTAIRALSKVKEIAFKSYGSSSLSSTIQCAIDECRYAQKQLPDTKFRKPVK